MSFNEISLELNHLITYNFLKFVENNETIILDDLGSVNLNSVCVAMELFYIINRFYNYMKQIIITSYVKLESIENILNKINIQPYVTLGTKIY